MTSLLHFKEKVHRKGLARVEGLPLLMPRLLIQVLEHLGFPEEPHIERRISCTQVLSTKRSLYMLISIVLQQQDREEVVDEVAKDPSREEDPVPDVEVEVERSPVPDLSPLSPPPSALAPADTVGPSYTAQQSPEHIHVNYKELATVMDAVCTLATTQASLDQRLARAEATIEHSHAMLLRIMSHLGLPPEPTQTTQDQSTAATSLDMLAAATTTSDPPAHPPPRD